MIEINNLTVNSIDEELLKSVVQKVLEGEGKKGAQLSIALVGQGRMRVLNKKYRGKNRVTDVLAFGQEQKLLAGQGIRNRRFPLPLKNELGLGEIVVCLREVKKNAREDSSTFEKELAQVLIHGVLHLLGYEHEDGEAEAEKMRKKQENYLSLLSLS